MKRSGFNQFQHYIVTSLVLVIFFNNPIIAHASYVPPLYCMGVGADCSTSVASGNPIPIDPQKEPCLQSKQQDNGGFLANFFAFLFGLFNPPAATEPCSATVKSFAIPSASIQSGSTQPFASTQPSTSTQPTSVQLIDRKVEQVTGNKMFITVGKLDNVQPGDILLAMIGSDYAHVNKFPPGWQQIRQDVKNEGHIDDLAMQSYYKIVTASEDVTYTWDLETGRRDTPSAHQPLIAVDLYAFRGVDPTNPILSVDGRGETEDPKAIECPSVKGIKGGMLICAFIGDDPGPIVAPSSMTQTSNFEIAGGDSYAIAYEALNSDDDTLPRIASWDNPGRNNNGSLKSGSDFAQAIVLRPMK